MCQPLFDGIREVEERIEQAPHVLLCLDYDGTLTHYAATPLAAHLSPQMERVLLALAEHEDVSLAIISGRDRADLQGRVGIPGLIYAGNHGMDISGPGYLFVEHTAAMNAGAMQELADRLNEKLAAIPGALVENKGLTISVHFRLVAHDAVDDVRRVVEQCVANAANPFVVTKGHLVFDIRPKVRWNKGSAVGWIKKKHAHVDALAIYIGDDVTDEDAFTAMTDGITVRVGTNPETAARYQLAGPAEVRKFLEWLDEVLRRRAMHVATAAYA